VGEPVKVLFIGGHSRSGSTLLDCMLGQCSGFFSTGELAYIWTHGLQQNRLCGCGVQFASCPFWRQVGEYGFGGWREVDADAMVALERTVNRHRYLPELLAPRLWPRYRAKLERHVQVLATLFRAIGAVSGARVIVDSTTDPCYGFLLRHVPGIDLRLVHFVRDSRGTAFSWTRLQRRTDVIGEVVYQRRVSPSITAVRWGVFHVLIEVLARSGPPTIFVRYEDLVESPRTQLERIVGHVGESSGKHTFSFLRRGEVDLETTHTVAGSLMRLRQGPLALRLDDEWKRAMRPTHRRMVTVLSWPLLSAYGYVPSGGD
jgi:Sulfotransferase family